MKKIVRLTENDLTRLVKKVIKEQNVQSGETQNQKITGCSAKDIPRLLNMIKTAPTFSLTVANDNPDYVLVKDPQGRGCAAKRVDIFK